MRDEDKNCNDLLIFQNDSSQQSAPTEGQQRSSSTPTENGEHDRSPAPQPNQQVSSPPFTCIDFHS